MRRSFEATLKKIIVKNVGAGFFNMWGFGGHFLESNRWEFPLMFFMRCESFLHCYRTRSPINVKLLKIALQHNRGLSTYTGGNATHKVRKASRNLEVTFTRAN